MIYEYFLSSQDRNGDRNEGTFVRSKVRRVNQMGTKEIHFLRTELQDIADQT